jgi:hyperosmotically inducible protein
MQETNTRRLRLRPIAAVAAAMAVAALAACNRPADDRTARGPAEPPIAKTERQPQGMQEDSRSPSASPSATPSTGAAPSTTERATKDVSDKVKDAAITTAVNAKLAQDKTLSAMRIDVDTVDGKVSLRGTAPDPTARERATALASAVDGVVSVDNQLVVGKG